VIIYCPVWVDQFGPRTSKTIMMSLLQVTGPLGIVLGYLLTALLIRADISWTISFVIQAIIYGACSIALFFTPNIYYSASIHCMNPNKPEEEKKENDKNQDKDKSSTFNQNDKEEVEDKKQEDIVSLYGHKSKIEFDEAKNFWKNLSRLLKIKVGYLILMNQYF
jgi:MFS family permease